MKTIRAQRDFANRKASLQMGPHLISKPGGSPKRHYSPSSSLENLFTRRSLTLVLYLCKRFLEQWLLKTGRRLQAGLRMITRPRQPQDKNNLTGAVKPMAAQPWRIETAGCELGILFVHDADGFFENLFCSAVSPVNWRNLFAFVTGSVN